METSPSVNLKYLLHQLVLVICAPNAINQKQLTVYKLTEFSLWILGRNCVKSDRN